MRLVEIPEIRLTELYKAERQVGDLTMLVSRLCVQLKKAGIAVQLVERAQDYLKRNGLSDNVLRAVKGERP